eukprot:5250062-Prymnesium_polylepis.1
MATVLIPVCSSSGDLSAKRVSLSHRPSRKVERAESDVSRRPETEPAGGGGEGQGCEGDTGGLGGGGGD